jgi:hypothetical protein
MRENLHVKMFEQYIKRNFSEIINQSPVNSMTPFTLETEEGREEYIFIVKAESWLYEPLMEQDIDKQRPMGCKAYTEGENLIFGFDIDPDINLETEIYKDLIVEFLTRLHKQKILMVAVVDHITMNLVWITNNYPFWKVKEKFNPLFKHYGII